MEINNNINSPYLHASVDKGDDLCEEKMKNVHDESRNIYSVDAKGSQKIKLSASCDKSEDLIMATTNDIHLYEESHHEQFVKSSKVHQNEIIVKSDSAKVEIKDVEHVERVVKEEKIKIMTQSSGESGKLFLSINSFADCDIWSANLDKWQ